jgi:hypothetical protein
MEVGNSPPHGERGDSSNRGGTTTGEPGKFERSGKAKKKTNNAAIDPVISGNPSAGHCNSGFTSSTGEGSSGGGGGSGGSGLAENTRPERVYKNLRQPSGDRDPDMRKTGKYDEIMIQRKIRGEHESVNTGPGVECFDCGSFFMEGGNRSLFANLDENKNDLLVISTSFKPSTAQHGLAPAARPATTFYRCVMREMTGKGEKTHYTHGPEHAADDAVQEGDVPSDYPDRRRPPPGARHNFPYNTGKALSSGGQCNPNWIP